MVNTVQSTYGATMDKGRPGLPSGSDYNHETGIVETVAGIGFGLAVSQGVADKGVVIGGTSETFRGVALRDVTLENSNVDKYPRYANMGYVSRGLVWVVPSHAVAPGDQVYFVPATGVLTNQAGGNEIINGAIWRTTAVADAYALVYLSGFAHSA